MSFEMARCSPMLQERVFGTLIAGSKMLMSSPLTSDGVSGYAGLPGKVGGPSRLCWLISDRPALAGQDEIALVAGAVAC